MCQTSRKVYRLSVFLVILFGMLARECLSMSDDSWQAIDSSNFTVYFKQGHKDFAQKSIEEAEKARQLVLSKLGQSLNKKANIFIVDPALGSNAFAMPSGDQPSMVLFVSPPKSDSMLGQGIDWQHLSVLHEYLHLVHLSEKYQSIWKHHMQEWGDSQATYSTSVPLWLAEGYAIHMESMLTKKGRLDNEWVKAFFDEHLIKGALPSYLAMNKAAKSHKQETLINIASGFFFRWLDQKLGPREMAVFWNEWRLDQAQSFEETFKYFFKKDIASLYGQFVALSTFEALSNKRPDFSDKNPLAAIHQFNDPVLSPIISPDKKRLALIEQVEDSHGVTNRLRIYEFVFIDAQGTRELRLLHEQDQVDHGMIHGLDWLDNNILLYSASDMNVEANYADNFYAWDLRQNKVLMIKEESNFRRFDVSEDKKYIAAEKVENGLSSIVIVKVANLTEEIPLVQGSLGQVYDFPKVNTQGDKIAYLQQLNNKQWQLVVYHFADNKKQVLPLPKSHAFLSYPVWSHDSRFLYFVAGVDRVVDLYAYDFTNGSVNKKTHGFAPVSWPVIAQADDVLFLGNFSEGQQLIADNRIQHREAGPQALASRAKKSRYDNPVGLERSNLSQMGYDQRPKPSPYSDSSLAVQRYQPSPEPVVLPSSPPMRQREPVREVSAQVTPSETTSLAAPSVRPSSNKKAFSIEEDQSAPRSIASQPSRSDPVEMTLGDVQPVQNNSSERFASQASRGERKLSAKERAYQRFNRSKRSSASSDDDIDSFLNAIIDDEPEQGDAASRYRMQDSSATDYINQTLPIERAEVNQYVSMKQPQPVSQPLKSVRESDSGLDGFFKQRMGEKEQVEVSPSLVSAQKLDIDSFFREKRLAQAATAPRIKAEADIDQFYHANLSKQARVAALNEKKPVWGISMLPNQEPGLNKAIPGYDPIASRLPPFDFMRSPQAAGGVIGSNCWADVGRKYALDPWLLYAIAESRSGMLPTKVQTEADHQLVGLMQLSDALLPELETYGVTGSDLEDPCTSIHIAAWGISRERENTEDKFAAIGRFFGGAEGLVDTEQDQYSNELYDYYALMVGELNVDEQQIAAINSLDTQGLPQTDMFFLDSPLQWRHAITQVFTEDSNQGDHKVAPEWLKVSTLIEETLFAQNFALKVCSAIQKSAFNRIDAALADLYNAEIDLIYLKRDSYLHQHEFKALRAWMSDQQSRLENEDSSINEVGLPEAFCQQV